MQTAQMIEKLAHDKRVPESQVRADMLEAMREAMSNPDPKARERWASFQYDGQEPTLEEFILWVAGLVKEM